MLRALCWLLLLWFHASFILAQENMLLTEATHSVLQCDLMALRWWVQLHDTLKILIYHFPDFMSENVLNGKYEPCFHKGTMHYFLICICLTNGAQHRCGLLESKHLVFSLLTGKLKTSLTIEDTSSAGTRLIWSGEEMEERVVRGVLGEGKVSQALQPLGSGLGICTPERWQHSSALFIQASKSCSLSQSVAKE